MWPERWQMMTAWHRHYRLRPGIVDTALLPLALLRDLGTQAQLLCCSSREGNMEVDDRQTSKVREIAET